MNRLSLQQVQYFLAVSEVLNFTQVAKDLYISQPALSKQIFNLEKELGFPLFIRDKRNVRLTDEGQALYQDWKVLMQQFETSISNAENLKKTALGTLNIGWINAFNYRNTLGVLIHDFKKKYPSLKTNVSVFGFKDLRLELEEDRLDLVFVPKFELVNYSDVSWVRFSKGAVAIAIAKSNPLAQKEDLTIGDLKDQPFIVVSKEASSTGSSRVKQCCRDHGFEPNIAKYVSNVNTMFMSVSNDEGVTLCHTKSENAYLSDIRLVETDYKDNDMDIVAIWKKHHTTPAMNSFIHSFNKHYEIQQQ